VPATQSKRYHHGDLKAALIAGAIQLIAERGVRGFSLAELSRRAEVSVAAPYRHFADRDELLAAVAVRALHAFGQALAAQPRDGSARSGGWRRWPAARPVRRRTARPVRRRVRRRPRQKTRYPELRQTYEDVEGMLGACVPNCAEEDAAEQLADAIEATAHGYAALLTDQPGSLRSGRINRAARCRKRDARPDQGSSARCGRQLDQAAGRSPLVLALQRQLSPAARTGVVHRVDAVV
jgi:AcrR family transcriptional regulator